MKGGGACVVVAVEGIIDPNLRFEPLLICRVPGLLLLGLLNPLKE